MSKKIKLAFIFENNKEQGGNFVTEISTAKRLLKLKKDNLEILFYSSDKRNLPIIKDYNIDAKYLKLSQPNLFLLGVYKSIKNRILKSIFDLVFNFNFLEKELLKDKIDLVHYNGMSPFAILLNKINFGVTFWDCGHIDHPEFPESTENYLDFENRESLYNLILKKSTYIITDSQENIDSIVNFYRIKKDKIYKIYSEPSQGVLMNTNKNDEKLSIEILDKFKIFKKNYLFYPAQFWSHKNHAYILEGINILKKKYQKNFDIVFSGTDKFDNSKNLENISQNLNLEKNLKIVKFVDDKTLYHLYKNSFAIVVPTYFGPTNHLPLEAFCLGVPVFYSKIHSQNEQVKGAVIDIDLSNPNNLAEKINEMIQNKELRENIIKKGYDKFDELKSKISKNEQIFYSVLKNFEEKRKNWS